MKYLIDIACKSVTFDLFTEKAVLKTSFSPS